MKKPYVVERECTCTRRFSECARGWHEVDQHDARAEALLDVAHLSRGRGVKYRAIYRPTGEVLEPPK